MSSTYTIEPIGWVDSCFDEKFGVPRQPGLVSRAAAILHFHPPYNHADAFEGLQGCSHIWVQFIFHQTSVSGMFTAKVRPPRLGGNEKLGVFATRSPNRPNRLGLSVLKLDRIDCVDGKVQLHVTGVDLVTGTPIVDIKPYLPYADIVEAQHPFNPPQANIAQVQFSECAEQQLITLQSKAHADFRFQAFRQLIIDVLLQDPRPAYAQAQRGKVHGIGLLGCNVQWVVKGMPPIVEVLSIQPSSPVRPE